MSSGVATSVVRQLESLFDGGSVAGLSDRQLIERFTARSDTADEAAFAALVNRHGPMVLDVCRQILGDLHDAEDAFQAVFLVLARKARTIREPDLLANWLYGVALRTARKARAQLARRRRNEEAATMRRSGSGSCVSTAPASQPAEQAMVTREQADVLFSEIERLPGPFRASLVLCYFEGLSPDEAARRLRCPAGTVRSRLARACDKLRRALARRGVAISSATLVAMLSSRSTSAASISSPLCQSTTTAAMKFVAGQAATGAASASAMALAQEVLRSMLLSQLRVVALSVLLLGAMATGAGYWNHSFAKKEDPVKVPGEDAARLASAVKSSTADKSRPASKPDSTNPGRMLVTGAVVDPEGKPVKGAVVDLVGRPRTAWVGASEDNDSLLLLGQGSTDDGGRFRLESLRTNSSRFLGVNALAAAPGFGIGWATLDASAERPEARIRLEPEQVVVIKLVDVTGRPAAGVDIRVKGLWRPTGPGESDGVSVRDHPDKALRVWPGTLKTDDQGKIRLTGIGRGLTVSLLIEDMRYARQDHYIETEGAASSKDVTIALEPARIIEGRVLAADSGQPIPHAIVSATTRVHNEHANGFFTAKFRSDAEGRFKINPIAGESYTLGAFPTGDEPYLIQQDQQKWTKGTVKSNHDIKVPRGVLIRGKVTEKGTGRPLAGSSIQYLPVSNDERILSGWQAIVASKDDGSYHIVVPAGKGYLLFFGPTPDFVLKQIGSNQMYTGRPGGRRTYAHAMMPYEAKLGHEPAPDISVMLEPGLTIKGRVEGPEGQTVTSGLLITTLRIEPFNPTWRGDFHLPIKDGRFEAHGLAPEGSARLYFLDAEHQWGASVDVTGKQANDDLTIRLEPCGQARARFITPTGQPVVNLKPHIEFVATPGASEFNRGKKARNELVADAELPGECRPQALLGRTGHRRRGTHQLSLPDPRRPLPHPRLLDRQR